MGNMTSLPCGWKYAVIDDILPARGIFKDGDWVESKDQDPNGNIRLIQLADIGDGYFVNKSSRFLTREKALELRCTFLEKGDLLVARMPDPLGRCCIFPFDRKESYVTVVDICVIRLKDDSIDHKYLMYLINSPAIRTVIEEYKTGSTRKRISRGNFAKVDLPIAPLNEQHRIVAKIEELFSEIDKGVESLKTAKAQLQVYRQALLKHAFEGKLTAQWRSNNPDKVVPAAELLRSIEQSREERYQQQLTDWQTAVEKWEFNGKEGKKPSQPKALEKWQQVNSNLDSLNYSPPITGVIFRIEQTLKDKPNNGRSVTDKPGGFRVLRLTCLNGERIDLNQNKEGNWEYPEAKNYIVKQGDFLISRGNGSIKLVGRGGVVSEDKDVAYPDTMIRLPVDENIFRSKLFSLFWNSALFRQQIEHSARTTAGIYKINQQLISNYLIPCFSLQEQDQILNILEAKTTTIDYLLTGIDNNLKKAEVLRQSILKKAFSGQLVPQDPTDEPASELLKRIQAEKAQRETTTKTKRKFTNLPRQLTVLRDI
jgi:type I restriction enzyme, S subunit